MWCISDPSDSMDNFNRFGQCQKFKLDIKSSEFIESKASKSVDVFNGCDFKKIVLIMMWWSFSADCIDTVQLMKCSLLCKLVAHGSTCTNLLCNQVVGTTNHGQ